LKADAMSEVLNIRIIEELREKIQGIYGGGTFGGLEKIPYGNYTFSVQLPCGPEKVDTLIKAVQKEFDDIAAKGPEQSYLDKVKKQWIEKYRTSLKQNETWLRELQDMTQNSSDPKYFLDYENYVNKLTTKDVQQAAKLILKGKNQFTAVLMPEKVENASTAGIGNRKVIVQKSIDLSKADFKVDLYDNGDIDGDIITVYFNGNVVASKKTLSGQPITLQLKANPNLKNELVMYAENLGKIPPNTALMKITANDQVYEVRIESDDKQSGSVLFKLK